MGYLSQCHQTQAGESNLAGQASLELSKELITEFNGYIMSRASDVDRHQHSSIHSTEILKSKVQNGLEFRSDTHHWYVTGM